MQTYTGNSRFPANLVPYSTVQGIACSDDAGARRAQTAPGRPSAFAPVRQAAPIDGTSNSVYGDPDPLEVGFPIRSGEHQEPPDGGFEMDLFKLMTTPAGPWSDPPPPPHNVNDSWVQETS